MQQQRRCLSQMTNGAPVVLTAVAATIHTLDAMNETSGGPALDVVSLFLQNTSTTENARVFVLVDGVSSAVTVLPGSVVQLFDETPFGGTLSAPAGGGTITVAFEAGEALSADVRAWGWFVRTQG